MLWILLLLASPAFSAKEHKKYKKGERVKGRWKDTDEWYLGIVDDIISDDEYTILFDDGDKAVRGWDDLVEDESPWRGEFVAGQKVRIEGEDGEFEMVTKDDKGKYTVKDKDGDFMMDIEHDSMFPFERFWNNEEVDVEECHWYSAGVLDVNKDGSVNVKFDNGTKETLPAQRVRGKRKRPEAGKEVMYRGEKCTVVRGKGRSKPDGLMIGCPDGEMLEVDVDDLCMDGDGCKSDKKEWGLDWLDPTKWGKKGDKKDKLSKEWTKNGLPFLEWMFGGKDKGEEGFEFKFGGPGEKDSGSITVDFSKGVNVRSKWKGKEGKEDQYFDAQFLGKNKDGRALIKWNDGEGKGEVELVDGKDLQANYKYEKDEAIEGEVCKWVPAVAVETLPDGRVMVRYEDSGARANIFMNGSMKKRGEGKPEKPKGPKKDTYLGRVEICAGGADSKKACKAVGKQKEFKGVKCRSYKKYGCVPKEFVPCNKVKNEDNPAELCKKQEHVCKLKAKRKTGQFKKCK